MSALGGSGGAAPKEEVRVGPEAVRTETEISQRSSLIPELRCAIVWEARESPGSEKLNAVALPNPSNSSFTLILSGQRKNLVSVKVMDISGRVLERYDRVLPNTRLRLGQRLAAGSYFIEITQGNRKKTISVIKVN